MPGFLHPAKHYGRSGNDDSGNDPGWYVIRQEVTPDPGNRPFNVATNGVKAG